MEPDIRKDVRLLLFWGIRSHDSGGMSEQGVFWEAPYPLRKAPLYFVQLLITILGRASPRPIHCQSNEAQVSKEACASLVFHVRTQKFLCEAQKAFGKHNWREPITRRARTARIGVSQPKQTRAKDVGALFVCGCPLARQRGLSAVVQLYPPTR